MNLLITIVFPIIAGIIAMLVHELPKRLTAYLVTHPIYRNTTKEKPKNILTCIDPIGLITFLILGVGWQKPIEYNSSRYSQKEKGILAVALTGILANVVFMMSLIPILKIVTNEFLGEFLFTLIYYNFSIAIVNLLPVPPLEMSKIIYAISHNTYFRLIQNERFIHLIFILLLAFTIITEIVGQLFSWLFPILI